MIGMKAKKGYYKDLNEEKISYYSYRDENKTMRTNCRAFLVHGDKRDQNQTTIIIGRLKA